MAVVTRPCGVFPCVINNGSQARASRNGRKKISILDTIKTQISIIAVSLTLFNSVRLPREAYRYGGLPYLVVYSFWLLVVCLPTSLLQLATGQLSQQDPVGVWRAVPILRGVGHIKVITSFLCCIYNMLYIALSAAYFIWIAKGAFPLKVCTKLQMTPHGYENKMNASECFNSTFMAPFAAYPQYLGIMAILIFIFWFFIPVLLYRLRKSMKIALDLITPVIIAIAIVLGIFLSDGRVLTSLLNAGEQWMPLKQPYIWQSALVQSLMSTHVVSGYLVSAGGTLYRHSDVRWTATLVIITNLLAGWLWFLLWESLSGSSSKDTSVIAILVSIYQSSVVEERSKEWPLFAFGLVLLSGVITMLTLLFPIYEKLHKVTGDNWKIFAAILSAVGTGSTISVVIKGLDVAAALDELVVPVLVVFTAALEVVGFVFIYGWPHLRLDIQFLTGIKLPWIWITMWWTIPVLIIGVMGWWLRSLLRVTWDQALTLWPLVAAFLGILLIMIVMAAIAVAKEEQYNLLTKIAAAFRPSRLWGPEEPMTRYLWMSQQCKNQSNGISGIIGTPINPQILANKYANNIYNDSKFLSQNSQTYLRANKNYDNHVFETENTDKKEKKSDTIEQKSESKNLDNRFRSPNICIADGKLGGPIECNCNRHFTLHVPNLKNTEITTSL